MYIAHREKAPYEFIGKLKIGVSWRVNFFQNHKGDFLILTYLKISNPQGFYFQNRPGLMDR